MSGANHALTQSTLFAFSSHSFNQSPRAHENTRDSLAKRIHA